MIAETLFGMSEACWILTIAGILLLVLAVIGAANLLSQKVYRHGLVKVASFTVVCMWIGYIAADKPARSGGDPRSPAAVLCEADSQDSQSPGEKPTRSGASTRLPDACDVGESEGFGAMPIATNLMAAAIAHGSNSTYVVFSWPFGQRPVDDIVYVYAGTNLLELAKVFSVDVSGCASNALVVVEDSDFAGTNACQSAFISAGDATDTDGDGLSDSDERFAYKTDPASSDTDDDGLSDGEEIAMGSSPLAADTDGDGLEDGEEIGYATILPDDDFLWLDVSNGVAGVSHYKGVSGHFGHVWLADGYSMTIQGRDCNELFSFVDGFVVISLDSEDLEPLYMIWNEDCDLRYDARSGGAVVVAGLNCDMAVMPGRCMAVVETNGASYAVYRAESQIANNAGLSGSRAVTYEVIIPFGEPDTVYVSYLDVGDSVAALDMDLGVQCPSMRSVLDTNELYTVLAPPGALRSRTTVKYFLGRNTDPRLLDTDGDGIPDGFPRVSEFDADGDGLADSIDPEPTVYGGDFHGQSTAWVTASFTNAEEILMIGYLQWVDSLVGEGLVNGLYKLTVSVPSAPANPVLLSVGDYRVVVTNTGDCVFLLEKGRRYDLEVSQPEGTNFVYAAFDDIGHGGSLRANGSFLDGHWKSAAGGKWLVAPVPIGPIARGYVFWKPTVTVSPANWQPTLANPTETFTATVGDLPAGMAVSYHWYSSDPSVVSVGSPLLQTTGMTWHPSGGESPPVLTLEVTVPGGVQTAVYQYGGDATAQTRLSLAMPDTLFVNDDDDMDDGVTDYNQGLSHLLDDDMVLATVTFISDIPTNGILRLENDGFTGLVFDGEFSPLVCSEWELENETSFERVVRINPTAPSQSYLGSSLRLRFVPDTGSELAATTRFTVVRPIVEPICTETTNVVEAGEMKSLVLNPCGVGVDREAYFKIDVEPADFPDDRIVWSASGDGEVQFRSGRKKGRRIGIFGSTPGDVKLDIAIGDAVSSHPTFDLRVVTNSIVRLSAWIIGNTEGISKFNDERIRAMVKMANDVYSQIGMTFDLGDRIVVTNIPAAYNIQEEVMTNGMWNIETLTSAFPSCGGLKCFFVNAIVNDLTGNETETIGMNTQTGLVVSSSAHISTLAHEIGHAIGMRDVYVAPDGGLEMTDVTRSSYSPNDWNGGNFCNVHGAPRYYPFEFRHSNIIRRMLMNGLHETGNAAAGADITFGSIQGYNALGIRMNVSTGVFYDGDDDNTFNPIHR